MNDEMDDFDIDLNDDDINGGLDIGEEGDEFDVILSNHKVEGTHSLKYDTIFKGKKQKPLDEFDTDYLYTYEHNDSVQIDVSSGYYNETMNNEDYNRRKLVKEKVYDVLKEETNINFRNRRATSKLYFNEYYQLLLNRLEEYHFSRIEIFNELAYYFTDNLLSMFKLLDSRHRNTIINELQEHIGKSSSSMEVRNRNLYENTEIEFNWCVDGVCKLYTGIIIATDYPNSMYKVNSYEDIYDVHLNDITKILNNTKFRYNLNKLNNIDFL